MEPPFVPFDAAMEPMGAPAPLDGCVFMTGGPAAYLPGLACVLRRLEAVGSRHPVVLAAAQEDREAMLPLVRNHSGARLMVMRHFPHSYGGRWGKTHVLDKLNVLGAPFRRVVWIDADVLIRRNVDELCALPANASFAAALNIGFRSQTCYTRTRARSKEYKCQTCAAAGEAATAARPACRYELNTAVMAVAPLRSVGDFNAHVVRPARQGTLPSRDGSDQGAINSLVHDSRAFGGEPPLVLPSSYNALARVASLRREQFESWRPALVHLSRETKPWQLLQYGNGTRARYGMAKPGPLQKEWHAVCGL